MSPRLSGIVVAVIVTQALAVGCVQSRASRNGVFNENQYIRKDFLIQQFGTTGEDPGWMLLGTITAVSTPNPLGEKYSLAPGIDSGQAIPFRFIVTEDKLQMVSTLEINTDAPTDPYNTPTVINAWPITNVDLQYQVNLDGETTNFYQENQERPWQQREWVKVQWDKNDMSDFAPMGEYEQNLLAHCVDFGNASSTLVPNSFITEPPEASASTPVLTDPGASPTDYMEWTINITMPLVWDDPNCTTMYGQLGQEAIELNKQTETLNLKYSMIRTKPLPANPASPQPGENTYVPLVVAEKDAIRHKYGFIDHIAWNRDPNSGVLAATDYVARFDPTKPIVWYFGQGFNPAFKSFYNGPGMLADQTNALFQAAGVAARVSFREYNDPTGLTATNTNELANGRQYGDIRYNFLIWLNDGGDVQNSFAGVTQFATDPRTGESLSSTIALSNFQIQDLYIQRIDAFLQSIGASLGVNSSGEWGLPVDPTTGDTLPANCVTGTTVPLVAGTVQNTLYAQNTVYQVMQTYLGMPASTYGALGPSDFIVNQDQDFYNAYYNIIRYEIFADPATNPYVAPLGNVGVFGPSSIWQDVQNETQFQAAASAIDHGKAPFDVTADDGLQESLDFINNFRNLTLLHRQYQYDQHFANNRLAYTMDSPDSLAFENVADHAARHCVNGAWETKEQWEANLISSYWSNVAFHEFGHSLGLTHNFMGSVDRPNFPTYKDAAGGVHYANYSNSIMEYTDNMSRVFDIPQWGAYDKGAITWIYANNAPASCTTDAQCGTSSCNAQLQCNPNTSNLTGQVSATIPWKDPNGFTTDSSGNSVELAMLFCNEAHLAYTPLCRQDDDGSTPSEIIANEISSYEWGFQWRNFRQYQKIWDDSAYASHPEALFNDMRKFMSLWAFDWSSGEIADTLRLIGVQNPDPGVTSNNNYFAQLTNKFNAEISTANQMVAAYHEGMLEQSAGQRPYATKYDPFFGDVVQQGIILDKLFAMQGFVGLWATDNYDQNQAGSYITYYSGYGDATFNDVAQAAVVSMVGGGYAVYPYFVPTAVALFAQDTHSPSFGGNINVRDWIGGLEFSRLEDFEAYFRQLAVQNGYMSGPGCPNGSCSCDGSAATCNYDPMTIIDPEGCNQFVGPDKRRYIWAYIADRNQYVLAQQDRNVATYQILFNYNSDLNVSKDDGSQPGAAYSLELPIKYTLDSFTQFN